MNNYYTLKVKEVIQETKDAIVIQFKQPLFKKINYKSGQFLTLTIPINGKKERRSYSICSTPDLDDHIAVMVKRVSGGLVSNYLNDHVKAGDSLEVLEPMGNFVLEPDRTKKRHLVFFAAGSGITPIFSMLKGILFFEPNSIVSLLYGNRHEGSIIFRKELDTLKQKFGERFNLVHTLTEYDRFWQSYKGRIDKTMTVNFVNLLPKFSSEDTLYFICGPQGMMDAVKEGLSMLKVPQNKIFTESFYAAPATVASNLEEGIHQVIIRLNGQTHRIAVPAKKTILETALDNGIDMPYSCQNGLCTACRCKCLSGSVKMLRGDGLTDEEIAQGYVLTCVGVPITPTVELEVG